MTDDLLIREDTRTRNRPALTLAVVMLGFLALPTLMSGTTVALPHIGAELDAAGSELQWVVVGYFLAATSLMLVAGSLGDLFGRRRLFALGAVLYAAGALLSAVADHIAVLDAARTLSGIGAAGVMASGGAVLGANFTGAARTRAFAAMGTTAGVGLAAGPTLSGWLIGEFGWRVTFGAFAVVGVVLWAGTAFMAESRAATRPRVDVLGAATFAGFLALVMYGVNRAAEAGWGSAEVLLPLTAGLVLLGAFAVTGRRTERPVLDFGLLRDRRFLAWSLASMCVSAWPSGVMVFLPTYLQGVNRLSVGEAGLTMLLLTVPVLVLPQAGSALVTAGVPPRILITAALLLLAAGNAWLTVLHPGIGAAGLSGPLVTVGAGMGLMVGTTDAQAMNHVPPDRLGMAAGFLNTLRGVGATLVIAVFGTGLVNLLQMRTGATATAARIAAGDLAGPERALEAAQFTDAWHIALWATSGACAASAITVWMLLFPGHERATTATPERAAP